MGSAGNFGLLFSTEQLRDWTRYVDHAAYAKLTNCHFWESSNEPNRFSNSALGHNGFIGASMYGLIPVYIRLCERSLTICHSCVHDAQI